MLSCFFGLTEGHTEIWAVSDSNVGYYIYREVVLSLEAERKTTINAS
jgi:hypothetical protein